MIFFELIWIVGIFIAVLTVAIHIIFAVGVYYDVKRLVHSDRKKPVLVSAEVWAIASLLGGVLVASAYWIIHRTAIADLEDIRTDFDIKDYLN